MPCTTVKTICLQLQKGFLFYNCIHVGSPMFPDDFHFPPIVYYLYALNSVRKTFLQNLSPEHSKSCNHKMNYRDKGVMGLSWFSSLHPVWQGFLATLFTYAFTALGALPVFFFHQVNQKILDMMMGFASGVMIAASFWSLLSPAIELANELGRNAWLTAAIGFMLGGGFVICTGPLLSKIERIQKSNKLKRSVLLTVAVTLHNIPEGMAVGVAFGSAALCIGGATLPNAMMLAFGIGLQNFPEGTCIAMPLRRDGTSRLRSFIIGQASGLVEPIAGVLGALLTISIRSILPLTLAFSAGAMIAVVCSELIPESFRDSKQLASIGVLLGFTVMMILDVALG